MVSVVVRARLWPFVLVLALVATILLVPRAAFAAEDSGPGLPELKPPAEGTVVPVKDREEDPAAEAEVTEPPTATWPDAATGEVDLSDSDGVTIGGLVVAPEPPPAGLKKAAAADAKVRVEVLDPDLSERAGVDGPLLRLSRSDGGTGAVSARLKVGFADFGNAYGADFGSRLRVVELPSCVADTPDDEACVEPEDVETDVDATDRTATATFEVPAAPPAAARRSASAAAASGGAVFGLAGGAESAQGSFAATKLPPSSTWSVNESAGGLNWSYPTRVPPVPGGLAPEVTLSYSSQTVDGETSATNNQGSWIGEGFTYEPGFIERRYRPCRDDGHKKVADQCWARYNATMMLGGSSSELVMVDENNWKLASDDGTTIKRLAEDGKNDDDNGEHWKVTTPDGKQYFFGLNKLPGWSAGRTETKSVWTVPVFGDDDKEPCHASTFEKGWCQQGWRWNLDYVKDTFGNVVSFFYKPEENHYALRGKSKVKGTKYDRGGYLQHIDYGQRDGQVYSTDAPARVVFGTAERCLPTATVKCGEGDLKKSTARNWPDVPYDRNCAADKKCTIQQSAPTFWTRKRLTEIRTEIRSGGDWTPVDSWALKHLFVDNADGSRTLWLNGITHKGLVGGSASLPSVDLYGIQLPNRVDKPGDHISPLIRFRLAAVYTDTGGQLDINYAPVNCASGSLPKPGESTKRCFPVKWSPSDSVKEPITDWFHKYVVERTIETDRTAKSFDMVTSYEYIGDAGWRKPEPDGITDAKYVTWSDWRGYEDVRVRKGDGQRMTTREDKKFFRGMDGTLTDELGQKTTDVREFMGLEASSVTYDGSKVVERSATTPWRQITHTQTETWGSRRSTIVRPETVRKQVALDSGGWRETKQITTYDKKYGVATEVDDLGDIGTAADDQCTTTSYVTNTTTGVLARVARVETVAVKCGQPVDRSKQVIDDKRTYYDTKGFGVAPEQGYVTKVDRLASHNGTTATYKTVSESDPDAWGREEWSKNGLGRLTKKAYTHNADGLLVKMVETNPLLWDKTVEYAPAWGAETAHVDANGRRDEADYDPLGRVTDVWLADRSKAAKQTPSVKHTYYQRKDLPLVTRTEKIDVDGSYVATFELYDGFGRIRQSQRPGPGGRLVADTFYTATGKVAKVNDEYLAAGAPGDRIIEVNDGSVSGQKRTEYDGADRPKVEIQAVSGNDKWRTVTTYGGDRVHVDPPEGGTPTTTIMNARNTVAELWQYKGAGPTGDHETVKYTYTPGGQVATYTDAAQNVWRNVYDQRGRLKEATSPDAGTVKTTYDDLDQVLTQTTADGAVLSHDWDDIGRKTATYRGEGANRTKISEWVFDRALKNQIDFTRRFEGTAEYGVAYFERDAFYRPAKTRYIVKNDPNPELNGTYEYGTTFNRDGTPQAVGYPKAGGLEAEGVTWTYDAFDRPIGMTGDTPYVTGTETRYTHTGSLMQIELNTGGKQAWFTWNYEEGTDRLTKARVDREMAPVVDLDANYTYDAAGNVKRIADTPAGGTRDVQCFTNDGLRRLTEAWTSASTAADPCAGGADTTGVGGAAPYHHSYTYDLAGNRKTEVRHGVNGGTDVSKEYKYEKPQPHAVSSVIETTASGTKTSAFGYDEAGNTTARNLPGKAQTLDWDEENRISVVREGTQSTSYVYGPDGNRWLRREPGAVTLYLPGTELRLNTTTKAVDATRYYTFGDKQVAMRTKTGVQFLGGDHQNTAMVAIDAVNGAITRRRTTAFGEERSAPSVWPNQRGFVGGIQDPTTGLTQLGARPYDPGLGRFLSVDPVTSPSQPQQMQGYGYSDHNPVTLADPDGRMPARDPDGGGNRGGNQSSWHNLTVLISWWAILFRFGLHRDVTADLGPGGAKRNTIPRAHKSGDGRSGKADIIMWGEDTVYIWEVKPGNAAGKAEGKPQIERYIRELQAELKGKGITVKAGPAIPSMKGIPTPDGKRLDIWMEPGKFPGLIFYGPSKDKSDPKQPYRPYPIPVPATQPKENPNTNRVPNVSPGPAPGTEGIPRLVPGPNGGSVSPAYSESGDLPFHFDPPSASDVGHGAVAVATGVAIVIGILWSGITGAPA
ncbi:RHS repeat-associated core domain-containing protein [Actinoplanes sp. NPDC051470]|uniref:RHS repeat-associated core domain-containing protein n=1 Tax=Actinoplanes sp. NPDC051470 TaxID=3157224 RepID=UPI003437C6F9